MKTASKVIAIAIAATLILGVLSAGAVYAAAATWPAARVAANTTFVRPMEALAKLLGMDRDEIREQRQKGKSLAEIAKAKGVDAEKVIDTLLKARKTRLDAAVKAGRLTQAEADKMLEAYKERLKARVNSTEACVPFGPGRGGQRGGGGGSCGGDCEGSAVPGSGTGARGMMGGPSGNAAL